MLTVRALDCQTANIHLDVVGFREPALVRGTDHVLPGAAGREAGVRREDVYRFRLEGFVKGTGADRDERALSWRVHTDSLLAVMSLVLAPGAIVVGPTAPALFPDSAPYLGLMNEASLSARCVSVLGGPVQYHMAYQGWSFEMECIDSPPEWVDESS